MQLWEFTGGCLVIRMASRWSSELARQGNDSLLTSHSIYLAVFNYLADIYGIYASSAQAAQSFCRNMVAGCFAIFVDVMFERLTYGGQ